MKVSQAIVEMLKRYQVEYIFGVPGDTTMPLYDAFYEASGEIRHILARDERSASFMADVYARVSFKPGVCEGPSGAGATYIIPGVAEAHASSIPMVVLTSDTPLSKAGKNVLTELDQEALFAPITKWNATLKGADRVRELLCHAFQMATTGRPGAVQITLPHDILAQEVAGATPDVDLECSKYPAYRTRPDPQAVEKAARLLVAAERPVMVCGGGVITSQAWEEVAALAEALDMPVGTSINGKGSIAEDHPLSIGVVGGNGGREYANRAIQESDLVLFVGCKTDSVTTINWTLPSPEGGSPIIHIDIDPEEVGRNYQVAVGVVGDAKLALADLLEAVGRMVTKGSKRREELAAQAVAWWRAAEEKMRSDSVPIKPQRVVRELVEALPEESVLVVDAGTGTPFVAAYFKSRAGRQVIIPRGHGGLGYAIPGVVGAKLAKPEATVIGLMGDGSFGMSAGELETIARLRLPVTIIQFNNGCFGWIKKLQDIYYQGRYFSVDFSPDTDYAAIAEGFGLRGVKVEEPRDLRGVLRQALTSEKATFIDVITESEVTETPPVHSWLQATESSGPGPGL